MATRAATTRRNERVVQVTGGLVGGVAFGISSSFGLFLKPITESLGYGRQVIGLATGVNFFLNGSTSIGFAAVADTYGPIRVLVTGAVLEWVSLFATSFARNEALMSCTIALEGFATAATSFGVTLTRC